MSAMTAAGLPVNEWLGAAGLGGGGSGAAGAPPPPPLDLAAVRDLAGVPVPTARRAPAPLGTAPLWCGSPDMVGLYKLNPAYP
jgi:hypothetical protein